MTKFPKCLAVSGIFSNIVCCFQKLFVSLWPKNESITKKYKDDEEGSINFAGFYGDGRREC